MSEITLIREVYQKKEEQATRVCDLLLLLPLQYADQKRRETHGIMPGQNRIFRNQVGTKYQPLAITGREIRLDRTSALLSIPALNLLGNGCVADSIIHFPRKLPFELG